jgi:hypothetical protein
MSDLNAALSSMTASISSLSDNQRNKPAQKPVSSSISAIKAPQPEPAAPEISARKPIAIRNEPFMPEMLPAPSAVPAPAPAVPTPSNHNLLSNSKSATSLLGRSAQIVLEPAMSRTNSAARLSSSSSSTTKRAFIAPNQPRKSLRPSFSEQLSAATAKASEVMHDLQRLNHNGRESSIAAAAPMHAGCHVLLEAPSHSLIVGKLTSKYPSVVSFYSDCAVYKFWHPFESKEITMIMNYGDMCAPTLVRRKFQFKINHSLGTELYRFPFLFDLKTSFLEFSEQFGADYQHNIANHGLTIEFSSDVDAATFKSKVLPAVKMYCD